MATAADIWRYRRLLRFLARRSLQKVYRRTVLGRLWLVILPLFPIVLRTIVFGALLNVPSDGVPYILFVAAGSLIWDLFALGLTWGTRALDINGDVAELTYLPRAIIPIGGMAPAALDFVFKLGAFIIVALVLWVLNGRSYLTLHGVGWTVGALAMTWLFALGLSFFTSVWGEEGRDTRILLGQVLAIWYLVTPVLYPMSQMPESWRGWAALNPMAPIVETFKWSVFGVGEHDPRAFAVSGGIVALTLFVGLGYFARKDAAVNEQR
jgi:lipopolysaccharide transport system permease protein